MCAFFSFVILLLFLFEASLTDKYKRLYSRIFSLAYILWAKWNRQQNKKINEIKNRQKDREIFFSLYHRIAYVNFRFCYLLFQSLFYSILIRSATFEFHKRTIKSLQAIANIFQSIIWHFSQFISIHDSHIVAFFLHSQRKNGTVYINHDHITHSKAHA